MEIVGIAAVDENGTIGDGEDLPWPSVAADKQQYRETVSGSTVLLGRTTYELMRDDLPGSHQIVLSRDACYRTDEDTVTIVQSKDEALAEANSPVEETIYVLGGESIYELFLRDMDQLRLSRIPGSREGTHTFPSLDTTQWVLEQERSEDGFTLEIWTRTSSH